MTFKQNYLKELPYDILDKIYLFVNKHNFNKCLIDIDNPKIKLFHEFNRMITGIDYFHLNYSLYETKKLGWFWNYHKNPIIDDDLDIDDDNEKLFAIYDLFHRDKRLSYKDYTKVSHEYTNIKYYRFKYTNTIEFKNWEIPSINSFVKKHFVFNYYVIQKTIIIIKRITFKKYYIHIYIKKDSYEDNTPLDIAFNLSHLFNVIIDCVMFLDNNHYLPFANTINYLETNSFLQSFEINDNVLTTILTDT